MAVERKKTFEINLGEIVKTRFDNFVNARNKIQAYNESEFQKKIMEEGMSYEIQIDYRKKQIEKEKDKQYPDNDFIKKLEGSFANLKRLFRYETMRKIYLDGYEEYKTGKSSVDSLIESLNELIAGEDDFEIRTEFENHLTKLKIERVNSCSIHESQFQA